MLYFHYAYQTFDKYFTLRIIFYINRVFFIGIVHNDISALWKAIVVSGVVRNLNNVSLWSFSDGTRWIGDVDIFFNRPCYDTSIHKMTGKKRVLIYGTPGIGKSFFLQRLLVYIVETAQTSKIPIPTVNYVRVEKKIAREYMLLPDGRTESYDLCKHGLPDYLLSDAVDLEVADGKVLSLEVASDKDSNYNQFRKRIEEAGNAGLQLIMPLFMFDEILQIKPPSMEVEEALFRFDVFGGSARNFINMTVVADTLAFVEETMVWYFGTGKKDLHPVSWNNILGKISQEFRKAKTEPVNFCHNLVNSMMLHKSVSGESLWASKFMVLLAGEVKTNRQADVLEELQKIIGRSGAGHLFESIGHRKLTASNADHILKPLMPSRAKTSASASLKINLFKYPITLLRSISDIDKLKDGSYGLPIFDNFPLVDAIIQPNMLLQFTISPEKHKGSVDSLAKIRSLLREKDVDKHAMVFVVPKGNLRMFKYQTGLNISQFITCDDVVADLDTLL